VPCYFVCTDQEESAGQRSIWCNILRENDYVCGIAACEPIIKIVFVVAVIVVEEAAKFMILQRVTILLSSLKLAVITGPYRRNSQPSLP